MKLSRIILALASIFVLSAFAAAQTQTPKPTQPEAKTKLETFQAKTGVVVVKGFSTIGKVTAQLGSLELTALELKDATSGVRVLGIRLGVVENGRYEKTHTSFIDYDEIDSLIKGIDYVSKATGSVTGLTNFEMTYKTRGELSITTFNSGVVVNAEIKSGDYGSASMFLSVDDLQKVRQLILDAKAKLDSIR